ncbi:MAG: hypothetical protein GY703_05720 [Gammaproteobacteria bacterium]|nr:hypothetical protein [Gammaproteobacteria bacterium]
MSLSAPMDGVAPLDKGSRPLPAVRLAMNADKLTIPVTITLKGYWY